MLICFLEIGAHKRDPTTFSMNHSDKPFCTTGKGSEVFLTRNIFPATSLVCVFIVVLLITHSTTPVIAAGQNLSATSKSPGKMLPAASSTSTLFISVIACILLLAGSSEGQLGFLSQFFSTSSNPINNLFGAKRTLSRKINNPATYQTTPETIKSYGYPVESHKVKTDDGYTLTMHRVPYGRNEVKRDTSRQRPVVYLQHGLFASSFEWFMNKPEKLLALRLADSGWDVWLGNARGNAYSRQHSMMSVRNRGFWEFSMHEMGKYDLPAEIDHALKTANQTKLHYIGFSMGTSMFWIMCSTRPEYNEKIKLMTALAPVVYINNMVGFPRLIAPLEGIVFPLLEPLLHGEFLPPWLLTIYNALGSFFCSNTFIAETICANINFLYAGWDVPQSQVTQVPLFYSHTPSPTSTRTLSHIAQLINTGVFQEYDFGVSQNLLVYGQPMPPKYSLKRTRVPVALFYGPNDAVVNPDDVQKLAGELPNVALNTPVNFSLWNHFDYHLGRDANELVNNHVLELLPKFL